MDNRYPYFSFIQREHGADPIKSAEMGYEVPRMLTFIQIIPHHHREPMEFIALEFIERKGKEARDGRYDHSWVSAFKAGYDAFVAGKELPREGTPIMTWERILKSRREVLAQRFPTVEDLAATPDSMLGDIGMDGRVLRDMAAADIQSKKDLSPVVKALADANETVRRQQDQIDKLSARLDALDSHMDDAPRRGRPRKELIEE